MLFGNLKYTIGYDGAELFTPAIANLEHWFFDSTINELDRMKVYIDNISDKDVWDFLSCVYGFNNKKVSNADGISPKPYVLNKIIKIPPTVEKEFTSVFRRYKQMIRELLHVKKMGKTEIIQGDSLEFSVPIRIDLAITSLP